MQFPKSAYFAIGYGQGMSNIDMVMFSKDGVKDLWSEGYGIPSTDSENNYVNTMQAVDNDVVTITTFRSRETGDSAQDFQFDSCGTSHEFQWAANTDSSSMVKHNKIGNIRIDLDEDCNVIVLGDGDFGAESSKRLISTAFMIFGSLYYIIN